MVRYCDRCDALYGDGFRCICGLGDAVADALLMMRVDYRQGAYQDDRAPADE